VQIPEMIRIANGASQRECIWLGSGFHWTDIEASRMHSLIGRGIAAQMGKELLHKDGAYWLHGLAKESDIYADLGNLVGHTLIVGTTRVGKTRLLDLLITQAIARGEPVIIIDPKGDHGLAENARKVCDAMGKGERFVYFHPAHPERSACIDPLRNWNRKTELASRIAALIPSETGADPFTAFGWKVLNDIVNGLIATGIRPNLVQLRRYIEGGPDDLLLKALRLHFKHHVQDWEARISSFIKQYRGNQLLAYISFYKEVVIHDAQSVDLDGLISTYEHNREHFQKMVASLIPILSMLTSDPLTELLSPNLEPGHERVVTDMARAIRTEKVLYVGLDSLADATVGSAIGSVLLADLAAVAGDRYNYGIHSIKPVNLFIDEAAEVINQPTIQLMNKGGGALFRVTIATQTFADFASRLGDENKARQVLANTNNKIALRILDAETQQYIADGIPKIKAKTMMIRYGHNVDSRIHDEYTASYQEQATEEEADLIPPAILSELPPLHFFARLSGGRTIKGRIPILKE
jgi:conjugal transfer pilus assembly protein TraD